MKRRESIMDRKQVIQFLEEQLKKMHEAHVDDLMKAHRSEELEDLMKEMDLDFSVINEFYEEEGFLNLEKDEIPREYLYELILYMRQSGIFDCFFLENNVDCRDLLYEKKEEVATGIADLIKSYDMCGCSIKELLAGKRQE